MHVAPACKMDRSLLLDTEGLKAASESVSKPFELSDTETAVPLIIWVNLAAVNGYLHRSTMLLSLRRSKVTLSRWTPTSGCNQQIAQIGITSGT